MLLMMVLEVGGAALLIDVRTLLSSAQPLSVPHEARAVRLLSPPSSSSDVALRDVIEAIDDTFDS